MTPTVIIRLVQYARHQLVAARCVLWYSRGSALLVWLLLHRSLNRRLRCLYWPRATNPGPVRRSDTVSASNQPIAFDNIGVKNCCSASSKPDLIHNLIEDKALDIQFLTKTWFTSDMQNSERSCTFTYSPTAIYCRPDARRWFRFVFWNSFAVLHYITIFSGPQFKKLLDPLCD